MVASREPEAEAPGAEQLYRVGVVGTVARMLKVPDGTLRILVQGGARVRLERVRRGGALPRRACERDARRGRRGPGAHGADAQRPADVLEHHRGGPVPPRGAADGGGERRGPLDAVAPDRRRAADQDRGEAGAARGGRRRQAAAAAVGGPRARARGRGDRVADPVAGAVRARPLAARVRAAPAAQGDPGGARRARPGRGGGRGPARAARADRAARRGPPAGRARALAARAPAAGGGRARRDPQLPRVDRLAAVGQELRGQPRPRARARGARRRPLRHREGQGPHHRVPGRAQAHPGEGDGDFAVRSPRAATYRRRYGAPQRRPPRRTRQGRSSA